MMHSRISLTLLLAGGSFLGVAAPAEVTPDRDAMFELLYRYMNPPGSPAHMYLPGQLPQDLPSPIPFPPDCQLIGSINQQEITRVVLEAAQPSDQLISFYDLALRADGWEKVSYPAAETRNGIGFITSSRLREDVYCQGLMGPSLSVRT